MTGKNKRIGGQKRACTILGLETIGIAEVVRKRLVSYVGGDEEKEQKVREIITAYVDENSGESPAESSTEATAHSQPPLFSQDQSYRDKVSEDNQSDNDESSDTLDNDVGNESLVQTSKTSTPLAHGQKKAASLSDKIKRWIGKPGVQSKDADSEDAMDFIDRSFSAMGLRNCGNVAAENIQDIEVGNERGSNPAPTEQPETIDLTSQAFLEEKYAVIQNTFKIIAAKDAQIESLEHGLSQKESVIVRLEEMNKSLIGKVDDLMSFQTEKVDIILSKLDNLEQKDAGAETVGLAQTLSGAVKILESSTLKISKSVQELEKKSQEQSDGENGAIRLRDSKWQTDCQQLMLTMAEKMENVEKMVGETQRKEEIMILSDSNGKHLDPKRLHHEKAVIMEHTYTLEGAVRKIPLRENPEVVKDIVFMTGLNDSKDHRTSVEEIVNRQKEACHKYHHRFKSARFHIVAVAPESQKQENLNKRLREYATSAGISFVSNDHLFDEQTGDIKQDMLQGYHYTPKATSIIAKQLKHSLYGNEPVQQNFIPQARRNMQQQPQPQRSFGPHQPKLTQQQPQPILHNQQAPFQQMNNAWQPQPSQFPTNMQQNSTAVDALLGAMGNFLQKWQTQLPRQH